VTHESVCVIHRLSVSFDMPRRRASSADDALQTKFLPRDPTCYALEPQNFFGHAISRKRLETGIYFHWIEKCLLSNGTILVTLDDPHTNIPNSFTVRHYTIARYILCYGPVLVRPSVWLGAERPHNAKSCRGTHVATSSSMRPIATDMQLWHGQSI